MNYLVLKIVVLLFLFTSCKQTNQKIDNKNILTELNSNFNEEESVKFLKEFYLTFYGVDEIKKNRKELLKDYVSSRILKKMDSLSQEDNLVIDYDPFIQGQDYNSESIKKTLEIKPLLNQNEYRVSFLLFGEKNEKATVIDFLLKKNENGLFEINSILNDKYLNFTKNLNRQYNNFYVLDSVRIRVQVHEYKILVLEKNESEIKLNSQHNSNPILIYDGSTKKYENNNLIFRFNENCPADGFQRVISKNIFFTIEQSYCKDFMFVQSYSTFRIDGRGDILLHKYGEEYTDRSDPDKDIPSKIWTSKDFGVVKFEDVNEEFLIALRNKE